MPSLRRLLPLALLAALYGGAAYAGEGGAVQFDTQTLEARGYSADLAAFFGRSPRFLPGTHAVTVNLNASRNYRIDALFDSEGSLCFDPALLAALKLKHDPAVVGCTDPSTAWPGARVKLFPGQFRVDVTLPEDAFDPALRDGAYQSGGTGLLLNYDLFAQRVDAPAASINYLQAAIEPGLNVAGWSLRNRGVFTQIDSQRSYRHQDAYAQRAIGSLNALMQIGQVNAFGEGFGGLPMLGAQIGSDSAQTGGSQLMVPIQGIVSTGATIEVRQRGRVVYRTVVEPGPFSLSNIDGLTGGADLDVEIIEETGQRQRFTVAAQSGAAPIQQASAWTVGVGRYRNPIAGTEGEGREPPLVMGEYSYNPIDRMRLTTSGMFATGYQSLSAQSMLVANDSTWVSGGLRYASTAGFGQGYELSMMGSTKLSSNLAGSLSWLSRSSRYAGSMDAFGSTRSLKEGPRFKHSADAAVSWAHPRWGAVSYALNHSSYFNGGAQAGFSHTLNAGRQFGRANLSLAVQTSPSRGRAVYANFSMPLGKGTLRNSIYAPSNGHATANATYNGHLGRDKTYSLSASGHNDEQRFSASTNMNTAYARLGAGVSQTTSNARSAYLSAAGALVYADGLFGTASNRVSDTFAIIQVPEQAGLRVASPNGTAITNQSGTAVIPSIRPYSKVDLRVDTHSLPLNVRLDTTTVDMGLTRGSVATHRVGATEVRQLLLEIRDSAGQPVPLGTSVYDKAGNVMGMIVGDGNFMLVNDDIGKSLRLGGGSACEVSYSVPERFDAQTPYEEAKATCSG
ncbi:fimbria/pilus outer membrane usher protein [Dyella sp. 20L07]|uniref:fimbria/pilus outer membrane usher protein n=1 Tax=Dyella sp. 20L07 TaxID=3384240 RepID=UPI003D26DE77